MNNKLLLLMLTCISFFCGCSTGRIVQKHAPSYVPLQRSVPAQQAKLVLLSTYLEAERNGQGAIVGELVRYWVTTPTPRQQISIVEKKHLLNSDFELIEKVERVVQSSGGTMTSSYTFPMTRRELLSLKFILVTEFWVNGDKRLAVRDDFIAENLLGRNYR